MSKVKPSFEVTLNSLTTFLDKLGGHEVQAGRLRRLGTVLVASEQATPAAKLKKLVGLKVADGAGELAQLVVLLQAASEFAAKGAGSQFAKPLEELVVLLDQNGASSFDDFENAATAMLTETNTAASRRSRSAPVREETIRLYLRRLEESLGDEGFADVYGELESTLVSLDELKAIAKKFANNRPKSLSRVSALRAIWSRHAAIMSVRAEAESRRGRTAA